MNIYKKYYSKEDNLFYVKYRDSSIDNVKTFKSFRGFAKFINSDLSDTNLYDYDFKGVDLRKYNVSKAGISSRVLREQHLYNHSFYLTNIEQYNDVLSIANPNSSDIVIIRELSLKEYDELNEENEICISYISDLHLNHKIKKQFNELATKQEIIFYINKIVEKLSIDFRNTNSSILFIGGDVSFNFNISELFYRRISEKVFEK